MKNKEEIRNYLNRLKEFTDDIIEDSEQMVSNYARKRVIEALKWVLEEE